MFSFWRRNFGKSGEIGSCWSTPHTVTISSDMLEDPSRCSDVLKDSSRCSDMRVGGTQGLTLDTTEAFPLGNQQVSKKLFSWNAETNISKYFLTYFPLSPCTSWKGITGKGKGREDREGENRGEGGLQIQSNFSDLPCTFWNTL